MIPWKKDSDDQRRPPLMKRGFVFTRANRVCLYMFECVFLYKYAFVCECTSLHVALSLFPTLGTFRIKQKAVGKKGVLEMNSVSLQKRLQPHMIFNWMITVKAGEDNILKLQFGKTQNGFIGCCWQKTLCMFFLMN